jgi:UDP-N-acetyl-D-glucosamine dehydrogenase
MSLTHPAAPAWVRTRATSPRVPAQLDGRQLEQQGNEQDRPAPRPRARFDSVVVGLGYVGLPTAIALAFGGQQVHGVDADAGRLSDILRADVGLPPIERAQLRKVLDSGRLTISLDTRAIAQANTVIVCVPASVDQSRVPDLAPLRAACATVVAAATTGQVLVLTSTSYVGSTEELLVAPLRRRGLVVGEDVHVCFSPERVDPGAPSHAPELTPRVVGGATPACLEAGAEALAATCAGVHAVDSLEVAEFTQVMESTFRALNTAFFHEMAAAATRHGIEIAQIIEAAARSVIAPVVRSRQTLRITDEPCPNNPWLAVIPTLASSTWRPSA